MVSGINLVFRHEISFLLQCIEKKTKITWFLNSGHFLSKFANMTTVTLGTILNLFFEEDVL